MTGRIRDKYDTLFATHDKDPETYHIMDGDWRKISSHWSDKDIEERIIQLNIGDLKSGDIHRYNFYDNTTYRGNMVSIDE